MQLSYSALKDPQHKHLHKKRHVMIILICWTYEPWAMYDVSYIAGSIMTWVKGNLRKHGWDRLWRNFNPQLKINICNQSSSSSLEKSSNLQWANVKMKVISWNFEPFLNFLKETGLSYLVIEQVDSIWIKKLMNKKQISVYTWLTAINITNKVRKSGGRFSPASRLASEWPQFF